MARVNANADSTYGYGPGKTNLAPWLSACAGRALPRLAPEMEGSILHAQKEGSYCKNQELPHEMDRRLCFLDI